MAIPVNDGSSFDPGESRRARQAEIFQSVCLKHHFPPARLAHFSIEDLSDLVKEVLPNANIEPALLQAALKEFLASNG